MIMSDVAGEPGGRSRQRLHRLCCGPAKLSMAMQRVGQRYVTHLAFTHLIYSAHHKSWMGTRVSPHRSIFIGPMTTMKYRNLKWCKLLSTVCVIRSQQLCWADIRKLHWSSLWEHIPHSVPDRWVPASATLRPQTPTDSWESTHVPGAGGRYDFTLTCMCLLISPAGYLIFGAISGHSLASAA